MNSRNFMLNKPVLKFVLHAELAQKEVFVNTAVVGCSKLSTLLYNKTKMKKVPDKMGTFV